MSSIGSLAFVGAFFTIAYKHIVGSLFELPNRSTNRARADAADDVQQVFATLINKYAERKKGRPLVLFVDDIDRIVKDAVPHSNIATTDTQTALQGKMLSNR